jgi:hypothetical protein
MATITYRKLDQNGDPMMGRGTANFVSDLEAVAQAISTKLKLFTNEWWENRNEGTPIFDDMLGSTNSSRPQLVAQLLKQRILETPYVLSVTQIDTSFDSTTRAFRFACQVTTQFGTVTLSN